MSVNKRFFLKFAAIACLSALLIGLLNHLFINGYYYTDVNGEVQVFKDVPYHITFANFGTSHGLAAFRYEEDDTSSFNFALSGEDIYHDFQTLKQFSDHLEKGCIVTIPVSYFSFCLPTDEPSQKRYYMYLDKRYIRGFNYETLINSKYVPVLRSIEFLFKDLIGDQQINIENFMDDPEQPEASGEVAETTSPQAERNDGQNIEAVDENKIRELNQHALTRSESWRSGRMAIGQKYIPENTQLLIDMIDYCKEQGFVPVMITIPVYAALRESFSPEELENYYYANIETVVKATGVDYTDYSVDYRLIYDPSYYNNSDHMSNVGSEAFLKIYKEDLASKGHQVK